LEAGACIWPCEACCGKAAGAEHTAIEKTNRTARIAGPKNFILIYLTAAEQARDTDIRRGPWHRHPRGSPPSNRRNNPPDGPESRENGGRIPFVLYRYQRAGGRRCPCARGRGALLSAARA